MTCHTTDVTREFINVTICVHYHADTPSMITASPVKTNRNCSRISFSQRSVFSTEGDQNSSSSFGVQYNRFAVYVDSDAFFTSPRKCGAGVHAQRTRYAHVRLFPVHDHGRLPDGNRDENAQNRSVSIHMSYDDARCRLTFGIFCFQKELTGIRRIQEAQRFGSYNVQS